MHVTSAAFSSLLKKMVGPLKGGPAAIVYLGCGGTYFYWQTKWHIIGTKLADERIARLYDALSSESITGLFAAVAGVGLLANSISRVGKGLGIAGLAQLKRNGLLTAEQYEICKAVILRDPSLHLVKEFLKSAERAKLKDVPTEAVKALRVYAEELSRQY